MRIDEIYKYCQDISRKDSKGNTFGIAQFNRQIDVVNKAKFQAYWKLAQQMSKSENKSLGQVIVELSDLRRFIDTQPLTQLSVPVIDPSLTCQYGLFPSAGYRYPLSILANRVPVTIKPYSEINSYRGSVLAANMNEHPVAFERGSEFEFIPNNLTNISLTFLRIPATPYYDYCLTEDDLEIFMPVGGSVKFDGILSQYVLRDAGNNVLNINVFRDDFTDQTGLTTYPSLSAELEWDDIIHEAIANAVLEKLGVTLRAPEVVQWTQTQDK